VRTLELSIKGLTEDQLRRERDSRRGPALVTALLIASLIVLGQAPPVEQPIVSVSPEAVDFGNFVVGSSSAVRSISITSASARSFRTRVSVDSENSTDFKSETDCATLVPQATCYVAIQFTPHTVGNQATRMIVTDEDGGVLAQVDVTGVGVPKPGGPPADRPSDPVPVPAVPAEPQVTRPPPDPEVDEPPDVRPEIRVNRTIVDFAARQIGSTSEPERIRLLNPGPARFSAGYVLSGNEGTHFLVSGCDGGSGSFYFGEDCMLDVRFRPQSGGPHDAAINIRETTNDGRPVDDSILATIELHGRGLSAAVDVTPTQLDFREPNPSRQRVIVRNSGEIQVRVYGADITGPDENRFRADANACRAQPLDSGGQCAITVSHSVSSSPRHTAGMVVNHSAGHSAEISLYWEPAPVPAFAIEPQSLAFGTVQANDQSVQTLTLTNVGNAVATNINATFLGGNGGQFQVDNGCQGVTIQPQGRCSIAVTFKPTRAGSFSSTLTVFTANFTASFSVPVNGQGEQQVVIQ
jgi:hypothetical protein